MSRARPTALPLALLLAAGVATVGLPAGSPAGADVVRTRTGLSLEGSVERLEGGALRVTTAAGVVVLPAADVAEVRPGAGPRTIWRREAEAAGDEAARWYRLALSAEAQGLAAEAREAHARVVALDPDHAASRRALGQERIEGRWLDQEAARRQRGLVLYGGQWLLPEELELLQREGRAPHAQRAGHDTQRLQGLIETSLVGEAALREAAERALAPVPTPDLVEAALVLLGRASPAVRAGVCRNLGMWGDESALRALLFHGARDLDEAVRREAVLAAASFGHDDVAVPFVRALGSENLRLAANAAQALAQLGDIRAAAYIVKRLSSHGSSTRNHVSFMNQVSYVRDYDVEIAQASNIANPEVGIIQDGVVLDVKVNDAHYTTTWIEPLLLDALSRLVGRPIASRAAAEAWYAAEKDRLPDFAKEPAKRAPRRAEGKALGAPVR